MLKRTYLTTHFSLTSLLFKDFPFWNTFIETTTLVMVFFPRYPFWCAKISLVKLYWDFCILKGWLNVNFWDMVLPTPCLKTVLLKLWVFWSRISLPNYKFSAKNQNLSLSTKFVETRKKELNSRGETWRWILVRIYPSLFDRNG